MPLSAAFTIEGNPNPAGHVVAYGATVDLAISSLAYNTITWSIAGTSKSTQASPSITLGGSPVGSTASFVMPADPLDGQGRSFRVKCRVTDSLGNEAVQYGIVGANNDNSLLPMPVGEEVGERHATHGWTDVVNAGIAVTGGGGGGDIDGVIAGTGLTGGGTSGTVTLNVAAADTTITVNADSIQVGTIVNANVASGAAVAVSKLAAGTNGHVLTTTGGTPTWALLVNANVSASAAIDVSKLAAGTEGYILTIVAGVPTWSAGSGAGDIDAVIAGSGLTGGGTSGSVTLNVAAADGTIIVNADSIQVGTVPGVQVTPNFGAQNVSTTGVLTLGTSAADTGAIRLPINQHIAWRNRTNSGNVFGIGVRDDGALNKLVLGGDLATNRPDEVVFDPSTTVSARISGSAKFSIGATAVTVTDRLTLGATPADTGRIGLTLGDAIKSRNVAGSANISLIQLVDLFGDALLIGGGGLGERPGGISSDATNIHVFRISGNTRLSISDSEIALEAPTAIFGAAIVSPTIKQADETGNGVNGETLLIQAQNSTVNGGGGAIDVRTGTGTTDAGDMILRTGATERLRLDANGPVLLTGPAWLDRPSAELPDLQLFLDRTVNFASGGGTITQRAVKITAPTYTADAALTMTVAATAAISAAPIASTNVTATNVAALWIEAGALAFGANFSRDTTALVAVTHGTTVLSGRNQALGGDVDLIEWGTNTNNMLELGGDATFTRTHGATSITDAIGGTVRTTLTSTVFQLAVANLEYASTVAAPIVRHLNTSGTSADLTVRAQGDDTGGNGGALLLDGGRHTSGLRGAVRMRLNPDDSAFEPMVEVCEVVSGQLVTALGRGANLTSTQMPTNTGSRVVYVANRATAPSANPVDGGILYAQNTQGLWHNGEGVSTDLSYQDGGGAGGTIKARERRCGRLQTTNATPTTALSFTIPDNSIVGFEIHIQAWNSAGGTEEAAYRISHAASRRAAGSAALVGTIVKESFEDDATWDVGTSVSSNSFNVVVTGETSNTIDWLVWMDVYKWQV